MPMQTGSMRARRVDATGADARQSVGGTEVASLRVRPPDEEPDHAVVVECLDLTHLLLAAIHEDLEFDVLLLQIDGADRAGDADLRAAADQTSISPPSLLVVPSR